MFGASSRAVAVCCGRGDHRRLRDELRGLAVPGHGRLCAGQRPDARSFELWLRPEARQDGRAPIEFTRVEGAGLELLAAMSGGAHYSMHSEVSGQLRGADDAAAAQWLQVTSLSDDVDAVRGTVANLLEVLAVSPEAAFELDERQPRE